MNYLLKCILCIRITKQEVYYYIGIVIVIHGYIMLHNVTFCYKIVLIYMNA